MSTARCLGILVAVGLQLPLSKATSPVELNGPFSGTYVFNDSDVTIRAATGQPVVTLSSSTTVRVNGGSIRIACGDIIASVEVRADAGNGGDGGEGGQGNTFSNLLPASINIDEAAGAAGGSGAGGRGGDSSFRHWPPAGSGNVIDLDGTIIRASGGSGGAGAFGSSGNNGKAGSEAGNGGNGGNPAIVSSGSLSLAGAEIQCRGGAAGATGRSASFSVKEDSIVDICFEQFYPEGVCHGTFGNGNPGLSGPPGPGRGGRLTLSAGGDLLADGLDFIAVAGTGGAGGSAGSGTRDNCFVPDPDCSEGALGGGGGAGGRGGTIVAGAGNGLSMRLATVSCDGAHAGAGGDGSFGGHVQALHCRFPGASGGIGGQGGIISLSGATLDLASTEIYARGGNGAIGGIGDPGGAGATAGLAGSYSNNGTVIGGPSIIVTNAGFSGAVGESQDWDCLCD